MLSNEKYTGNVRFLKLGKSEVHYLGAYNHLAIISPEMFEVGQIEKTRRSNVMKREDGNRQEGKKYSLKERLFHNKKLM